MPLESLYQKKILKLSRIARKINNLCVFKTSFTNRNPICGDVINVTLDFNDNNEIINYGHEVNGCVLCEASAGLLSNYILGKSIYENTSIDKEINKWLKNENDNLYIKNLDAFTPVKDFTNRFKCVTLPFEAFVKACNKI